MTTLIVSAMTEELAVLRARLAGATALPITGAARVRDVVSGRLGGHPVVLAATGDGARNAREGIAALLAALPVRQLLVLGISGGLTADLRAGDVVVATRVVDEAADASTAMTAPGPAVEAATRASGARPAVIVSGRHLADSVAEKRRLAALAGATTAGVDLESAGYVAAAQAAGLPWTILRAVSDTADEALPALLNRARDEGGAVRRGSVVRGLFGDPGALPALMALRRRLKLCAESLARAATAVVTGGALPSLTSGAPGSADAFVSHTPGTADRPGAKPSPGAR